MLIDSHMIYTFAIYYSTNLIWRSVPFFSPIYISRLVLWLSFPIQLIQTDTSWGVLKHFRIFNDIIFGFFLITHFGRRKKCKTIIKWVKNRHKKKFWILEVTTRFINLFTLIEFWLMSELKCNSDISIQKLQYFL